MARVPVITVDGPAGVGKGTIATRLARTLRWHYLESGALYRLVALQAMTDGVAPQDTAALVSLARQLRVSFDIESDEELARVRLDGRAVDEQMRGEACARLASTIAPDPGVRAALLDLQHGFRKSPGLVADGRDMGTVVFPDAQVKIFLTASAWERAGRRYKQLKAKGADVSLRALFSELIDRDRRDRDRVVAPLKPARDAVVVDTTGVPIEGVLARVTDIVEQRLPAAAPGR